MMKSRPYWECAPKPAQRDCCGGHGHAHLSAEIAALQARCAALTGQRDAARADADKCGTESARLRWLLSRVRSAIHANPDGSWTIPDVGELVRTCDVALGERCAD